MRLLPILLLITLPALGAEQAYRVIAYHDVQDEVAGDFDPDQYAVSTRNLIEHFTWLRDHGFHPVGVDQIVAAHEGRRTLPGNAVLLTFDDGLVSAYTRVFPLLKLFGYPAVVSIVTSWIETEGAVEYAGRRLTSKDFLNWSQIREMQESGLVEIASHSHDLHRGIRGNPQGNLQPAAVTRGYDGAAYESDAEYRGRIGADLALSVATIAAATGVPPRMIAWPYGAYNDAAASVAAHHGMHIGLGLGPGPVVRGETLQLGRHLAIANPGIRDLSAELLLDRSRPPVRMVQLGLDSVFDPDPLLTGARLDTLLDRVKALQISHVFLRAVADDDGDGVADAAYFPNRHLPVRADLFNHVAWQLRTRANVRVFAWLPLPGSAAFDAGARESIADLYEDLAAHAHFDGLVFRDGEGVDGSAGSGGQARATVELSAELLARARRFHPELKSVRSLVANAPPGPAGTDYLAQDFDSYLDAYDYVALTATPAADGARAEERFYERLVAEVSRRASGLDRTIFELQARWPSEGEPDARLRATMWRLQSQGVRHLGYYPEDFIAGHPDIGELRLGISLAEAPGGSGL